MRMRVVDAKQVETPLAELHHQTHDFLTRYLVISDGIGRDILRRKRLCDQPLLSSQNPAALQMRMAASMFQDLSIHFAATQDGACHSRSINPRTSKWRGGSCY